MIALANFDAGNFETGVTQALLDIKQPGKRLSRDRKIEIYDLRCLYI